MTSFQPSSSNAQSIAAAAPSTAYPRPQQSRMMPHPTSVPGQPSGIQGPRRPTHRCVDRSSTENMEKPCICHAPATVMKPRQASASGRRSNRGVRICSLVKSFAISHLRLKAESTRLFRGEPRVKCSPRHRQQTLRRCSMLRPLLVIFGLFLALELAAEAQQPGALPNPLPSSAGTAYVIRAGRLIDPESGTALANQMIAIKDGRILEIGSNVSIPQGAETIDLSLYSVLPGLVDAHNHLALTYTKVPENDIYYYTYIQESTALRAIQAASNGMQMLSSGFTVVRDLGNNGLYADTALRQAIEQGWIPGPTLINSGIIIGGSGGQFYPTPEMYKEHNIIYPEYLDADTPDEIIKAARQNVLFGAKVIKICVDCKPYPYSVEDMK